MRIECESHGNHILMNGQFFVKKGMNFRNLVRNVECQKTVEKMVFEVKDWDLININGER